MKGSLNVKSICLFICMALAFSGCLNSTENPKTTTSIPEKFTPEPTPEGQWAGLAYEAEGWELITYDGNKKSNIYFPEYLSGMEILVFPTPYYAGCELTYWHGGWDGYNEEEWDLLDLKKFLGDNQLAVRAWIYQGELVQLTYLFEPMPLGFFSLRFGSDIDACVSWAEKLLSTLDPEGLEIFQGYITLAEKATTTVSIPEKLTPKPAPEERWAGLAYRVEGWELITYEGYEKNAPSFPEYMSGMQILIHPNIDGCMLTYWYGGTEYLGTDWDLLEYDKKLGDHEFNVGLLLFQRELVRIGYGYQPRYLGWFPLRLGRDIDWCVWAAEKLLSTLDPAGMEIYQVIHVEREVRRQTTGIP